MALPTPRDLLTSLIATLSSPSQDKDPPSPNPLRGAPPEKAALLSALHVLFPSLLLPALDLLDRGLVTRVLLRSSTASKPTDTNLTDSKEAQGEGLGTGAEGVDGDGTLAGGEAEGIEAGGCEVGETKADGGEAGKPTAEGGEEAEESTGLYVVRSLASTMKRRDESHHVVLLRAWTCSCPSFTIDSFPPLSTTTYHHTTTTTTTAHDTTAPPAHPETTSRREAQRSGGKDDWSFGGLGTDEAVPCCKHLLACVLAERWAVLGGYVPMRRVGRGEMAGLVAGV